MIYFFLSFLLLSGFIMSFFHIAHFYPILFPRSSRGHMLVCSHFSMKRVLAWCCGEIVGLESERTEFKTLLCINAAD